MLKKITYIIKHEIYWKGIIIINAFILFLAISITIVSQDISNLYTGFACISILFLYMFMTEYQKLNYIPIETTPLLVIKKKYNELSHKYEEQTNLNQNKKQLVTIHEQLIEFNNAIKTLEDQNEQERK